jgi:hypothetical protein
MTKKTRIVVQLDGGGCSMLPTFGVHIGNVGSFSYAGTILSNQGGNSMKTIASRLGLSLLLLAVLFASGAAPARAEAITINENTVSPVAGSVLVACAAGGAGELVDFTGNFHYIYSFTGSSGGPVRYMITALAQNVVGVGQVTGDSYVLSGGYIENGVLSMAETWTALYDVRVIGQGVGNNFIARTVSHYTINANGELVVDFVITDATCM